MVAASERELKRVEATAQRVAQPPALEREVARV